MKYKYQFKFSKNSLPVYLIVLAAIAVAISSPFWSGSLLVVLLCVGVAGYITWQVAKILFKMIASNVVTYDEGFTVTLPSGEKKQFDWSEITHAGKIVTGKHAGAVFAYNENIDTFTQLTAVFSDFEALEAEMKAHLPMFTDYHLEPDQSISEYLHDLLTPEDGEDDENCGDDDTEGATQHDVSAAAIQSTGSDTDDDDDRVPNTSVDDDDDREPDTSVDDD